MLPYNTNPKKKRHICRCRTATAFCPVCIAQLSQVELLRRRLRLNKNQGASLAYHAFFSWDWYKLLLWGQRQIEQGAWFFAPFSWLFGLAAHCKNRLYDGGWAPVLRLPRPIVSIGNIIAGGAGKTPLVHLLASQFPHRKVAILSHGYGCVPDEALLLQRRLPKARIYVGKNRKKLARQAMIDGAQLLILDDGFQYRTLHRDFDFVIVSGNDPFGRGHYLPWGFLRDSPRRLTQADALFVSGKGALDLPHIALQTHVTRILNQEEKPVASIQGWPIAYFCGIARPAAFKKTLLDQGARILAEWILADHAPADPKALSAFAVKSKSLGVKAILCTEKDWVKIDPSQYLALPILFVEISCQITSGHQKWENLIAKIDQKIDNIGPYEW